MLTDEQIQKIRESIQKDSHLNLIEFARAIEQAARREALSDAVNICADIMHKGFNNSAVNAAHECVVSIQQLIAKEQS